MVRDAVSIDEINLASLQPAETCNADCFHQAIGSYAFNAPGPAREGDEHSDQQLCDQPGFARDNGSVAHTFR